MTRRRAASATPVDAYLAALVHPRKAAVQELRRLVLSLDERIGEEVKWNAPSFFLDDHFATFRLHPAPAFQLVLHIGTQAKGKPPRHFSVPDPRRLLRWAAPNRCVVTFRSDADALSKKSAVAAILRSWMRQRSCRLRTLRGVGATSQGTGRRSSARSVQKAHSRAIAGPAAAGLLLARRFETADRHPQRGCAITAANADHELPVDWESLRTQLEYSHATAAVLNLAAFALLIAALRVALVAGGAQRARADAA